MPDVPAPSSPAAKSCISDIGGQSSAKKRKGGGTVGAIGGQVEDEMLKSAKTRILSHLDATPALAYRVLHLLDSGKLTVSDAPKGEFDPLPSSCNKWFLIRKERWQIILRTWDELRFETASTEFLTKDEMVNMACYAMEVDKNSALPQTKGDFEILIQWTVERYQHCGSKLKDMKFKKASEDRVTCDWEASGGFRFETNAAGSIESLVHIKGAKVALKTAPLGTYRIEKNWDERSATLVDLSTDFEVSILKLFKKHKQDSLLPQYQMIKTVKDSPLEPSRRMAKKGKGAAQACALLDNPVESEAPAPLVPPPPNSAGSGGSGVTAEEVAPPPS